MDRIRHPQKLDDHLSEPDSADLSFLALFEGWVDDLLRLHASLDRYLGGHRWELVVVDNPVDEEASERIARLEGVVHAPLRDRLGWGAARNLGLRMATGSVVCIIDSSVELAGDIATPLSERLSDTTVGLVGRWGVTTEDGFTFGSSPGPDVDGVEAYFMAARRADLCRIGLFDPKFKWYRNADIDYSFRVRDAGLRTIVDPSLPLVRHSHRLWETTSPTERDELSRKNFARFRRHWAEREDLFLGS